MIPSCSQILKKEKMFFIAFITTYIVFSEKKTPLKSYLYLKSHGFADTLWFVPLPEDLAILRGEIVASDQFKHRLLLSCVWVAGIVHIHKQHQTLQTQQEDS